MRPRARLIVAIACVAFVLVRARMLGWTADDAFVSFRYAQNLVAGRGLVFNTGERVEGYTNFLWTLWCAPALALGVVAETWTAVTGALALAATVALMVAMHARVAARAGITPLVAPFGALALAAHTDSTIYAVSGLETAAFTLFAFGGFAALASGGPRRAPLAGALFSLAILTRPDGVVFAGAALAWVLAQRRVRDAVAVAAIVAVTIAGQSAFRLLYYGDLLPNTYYAKSAGVAWWSQGAAYLFLYLLRYPVLAVAPLAVLWLATKRAKTAPLAGAALFVGLVHVLWVVEVGGDFMFGRFLVPSAPFLLLALDAAILEAWQRRPALTAAVAAAAIAAIALVPLPVGFDAWPGGIADERGFYSEERARKADAKAEAVRPVIEPLGVSTAFYGGQARFVYRTRVARALEAEAGLTDRAVARQPLEKRGRVGHEKHATAEYLVAVRHVDLAFGPQAQIVSDVDAYVPYVSVEIGGVRGQLLHWDDGLVRRLRERGAIVEDFPARLDAVIAHLDAMPDDAVRRDYERASHFYFAFAADPAREAPFKARLGLR